MSTSFYTQLLAVSLFIVLIGCDRSTQVEVAPTTLPPVDVASSTNSKSNISDEEANTFATHWIGALERQDSRAGSQLIAWRYIVGQSLATFNISDKEKTAITDGFMTSTSQLVGEIANVSKRGGDYRFVHVLRRGGAPYVLFRINDPELGFNYHQLRLRKVNGKVEADQFFTAVTGEEMSETLRNLLAPSVESMSVLGKLSGAQKTALENLKMQKNMKAAIERGQPTAALQIYQEMPDEVKKSKMSMLHRITATPVEDEEAYATAINEFLELFPDDASVGMVTLDSAVIKNDPELLLQGYDALQKWTGGDPFLSLMVAANLAIMGRKEKAKELVSSIDVDSLGMSDGHDYRLTVALEIGDHAEVLKQLRILKDEYGYAIEDLRGVEGYEDFVNSEEFKQWSNQ